jgi:GntR family transcriptional regulator
MAHQGIPAIVIDWNSAEPVYTQIARQIRACIVSGELPPGAVLPGVRTVASDLGVNLNTVARAYRMLEDERFIDIRDRAGATVAAPQERADDAVIEKLTRDLELLFARLRQAGLTPAELRRLTERILVDLEKNAYPIERGLP